MRVTLLGHGRLGSAIAEGWRLTGTIADPTILTRMIDQFARNLTESEQQTQLLSTIERGLVARGIIGRF